MRSLRLFFALLFVISLLSGASAEYPQKAEESIKFSSKTELVTVPVIVTRGGKHVAGLTKDQFSVTQDGDAQVISSFEEINTTPPALASATPPEEQKRERFEFSNIGPVEAKRYTIIAIDLVTTNLANQRYGKEGVLKFLKQNITAQEPIALLAVTRGGVRVIHEFTTDPHILVVALGQLWNQLGAAKASTPPAWTTAADANVPSAGLNTPGMTTPGVGPAGLGTGDVLAREVSLMQAMFTLSADQFDQIFGESVVLGNIEAIDLLARAYTGLPGRKSLVWVSEAAPFPPSSPNGLISERTARVLLDLNSSNMAIYPVDPAGLVADVYHMESQQVQQQKAGRVRGGISAGASAMQQDAASDAPLRELQALPAKMASRTDALYWIANATGGRAVLHTNDASGAIARAGEDSSQYYLLSYYVKPGTKPGWHGIKVKVNEPHADVRTRTGVLLDNLASHRDARVETAQALGSPLELTAVPVIVRWMGQGGNSGEPKRVDFEVSVPPRGLMIDDGDTNHISLTVTFIALNAQGKVLASASRDVEAHLTSERLQQFTQSGLNYSSALAMEPGRYIVKFMVRDNISGHVGTVSAPLRVM